MRNEGELKRIRDLVEQELDRREEQNPGYKDRLWERAQRADEYFRAEDARFREWFDKEYHVSPAEAEALQRALAAHWERHYEKPYVRFPRHPTLGYYYCKWVELVQRVEDGFRNFSSFDEDDYSIALFNKELLDRLLLAVAEVSPSLYEKLTAVIRPWDERFLQATYPIPDDAPIRAVLSRHDDGTLDQNYRTRVEAYRIPNRMTERLRKGLVSIGYILP